MSLILHNPHSVLAVLERRPRDVVEIHLAARQRAGNWAAVAEQAARLQIPVLRTGSTRSGRRTSAPQQGGGRTALSFARVRERAGLSLQELFAEKAGSAESAHRLFLALDCLQDPHNVGAVFRTAAFFGVQGIVMTKDRSAPLNATVYDVASGGVEYVPFCVQANLSRALEVARKSGLWVLGTSEHAETDYRSVPRDRSWLLVLGNEEKGLRRLTAEKCDVLCRIAPSSPLRSLNVSVAAGILIAHFAET